MSFFRSDSSNDFSKGSMWSNIMRQAIPLTIAQLINVLYNIVDRMYIGHIPGTGTMALTGLGISFPILMIITAFTNLFGRGGAPLASILRGEGKVGQAQKIMNNSFTLLIMAGIITEILAFLIKKPVLYAFGASDATYPYADAYLSIYLLGTPFSMVGLGMNNFINVQGFPTIGMATVAIGALLNIVLDPLFIFVFGMGVKGAALATILSQAVSCVWVLCFLCGKKAILHIDRRQMRVDPKIAGRIIALGTSDFTAQLTNSVVQIVYNSTLSAFGGDIYVGMMTILNSIREVIFMPISGLNGGGQPVLGYNYGAEKNSRVCQGIRIMAGGSIVYCTAAWALLMFFPLFFVRIFTSDPALLKIAGRCVRLYYMGVFLMSLQMSAQSIYVSLGKAKKAIFFSLFRKVILVVPLALILPHLFGLGIDGVFLSEPISDLIGGGTSFTVMMLTVYRPLKKSENAKI